MFDTSSPEAELERVHTREERYGLGQFFTPAPIAELMGVAVDEVNPQTVLDPGIGGGVLLRACKPGPKLYGLDIDAQAVELSQKTLPGSQVVVGDFLDRASWPFDVEKFDAIVSNPPYIRHHNLSAAHKGLSKHYAATFGGKVSSLSGSYVYFMFEALLRLREGGRFVFITPTEFLDVRYGGAIKQALLDHCDIDEILVLEMDELAFEGVLTTSAITIATKRERPSRRVPLVEGVLNGGISRNRSVELSADIAAPSLPWTPLLPSRVERIAPLLVGRTAKIGDYCRVRRGIATGDNRFFCMTQAEADERGIEEQYLVPVVVGSKDLPRDGNALDEAHYRERLADGARGLLFWCHDPEHVVQRDAPNAWRHIESGKAQGLHERFNCKTRSPWYGVEKVAPADFFCTYMSRDAARIVRNLVGARCMTSLLNIWAKPGVDADAVRPSLDDPENAQVLREFGRTYGGGLGKIEPGDLVNLPIRPPEGVVAPGQTSLL